MDNNFKINDWVKITMKRNAVIAGQLVALGTKLYEDGAHDFYQVKVLNDRETSIFDTEIKTIEKMYTMEELEDMVIEIVKKHDIALEDCPDHISEISAAIVFVIGCWNELSGRRKRCGFFVSVNSCVYKRFFAKNT